MNKWATAAGILVIAGFCVVSFINLSATAVPRLKTAAQVRSSGGREVRFEGRILRETVSYDENTSRLSVDLADRGNDRVSVRFEGVKPDGFDEASYVRVTGRFYSAYFAAKKLEPMPKSVR